MGRKPSDSEHTRYAHLILLVAGVASCALVYAFLSVVLKPDNSSSISEFDHLGGDKNGNLVGSGGQNGGCCRGIEHLELWGAAVKWGSEFKVDTAEQCCHACKGMCSGDDGPCLCDSWVFCGNKEACGPKFGECWLKKQKDTMSPEKQDEGPTVMWTSGIVFGKGEGIVSMETEHGTMHIKLYPDCAPRSVAFILELLGSRHCAGCRFHRAESRGQSWDSLGNHVKDASFGPPYGLIQGTLEAQGLSFKPIPVEACPTIQRGSVAWVGSGPEFFISLANHQEWKNTYTVFGSVLPEDMEIAEKIASLPTKSDLWNNVNVTVLRKRISLTLKRASSGHKDISASSGTE
uniref:PPIase cyclophilin-type domain-containing protein n=1 Tax=Kalanchoe fedtschenkoi TaxID=63787 RepID=A0A7N0VL40_KALFE